MNKKPWIVPEPVRVPDEFAAEIGGHRLTLEMLVRRGFDTIPKAKRFMHPERYTPAPPADLPGMAAAGARLVEAIEAGETIGVWGDFDVDGQTATALLVEGLRALGGEVIWHIPVRAAESHGLNIPKLGELIDRGAQLVLTCDTGSDGRAAVEYAAGRGVDVIVTDHHSLPDKLPEAAAFVNPQMVPADHPLRTLPGVGVAYKLIEHLEALRGESGLAARALDLVALGIVADVAEQVGDTRYLLQLGLEALRTTERPALRALYDVAGIEQALVSTEDIGFGIGPRLNALGRLGDANPAVEFFVGMQRADAVVFAANLDGLNAERRLIGDQIAESAVHMIESDPALRSEHALVLAREGWEPGIIGIVASQLVEQYGKPVVLISLEADGAGRGSARSVDGVDITEAIATQADLLESFGGHPMAAGLSLDPENIPAFRRGLSGAVADQAPDGVQAPGLEVAGYLTLDEISLDLLADFDRLAPFGRGNVRPVFAARDLQVRSLRKIGREKKHLRIVVEDESGQAQKVLWWGGAGEGPPEGRFDLAFTLSLNAYRGNTEVQLTWMDAVVTGERVGDGAQTGRQLAVIDLRTAERPEALLDEILRAGDAVVWGHPDHPPGEDTSGGALVIWTPPPGPDIIPALVERFRPTEVYLLGVAEERTAKDILSELAARLNYALGAYDGETSLTRLAESLGQSTGVVTAGLRLLETRGYYEVKLEGDDVQVRRGTGEALPGLEGAGAQLSAALEDSAVYRRFYLRAEDPEVLVAAANVGGGSS